VGKLLAYLDRSAARDAWDLAYLPAQAKEVMQSERFRPWFIALSAILDHLLTSYTRDFIEKRITDRTVAEQLAPMLIGQTSPIQPIDLFERSWAIISPFMMLRARAKITSHFYISASAHLWLIPHSHPIL